MVSEGERDSTCRHLSCRDRDRRMTRPGSGSPRRPSWQLTPPLHVADTTTMTTMDGLSVGGVEMVQDKAAEARTRGEVEWGGGGGGLWGKDTVDINIDSR
jgi:hypothetical protein